ncbi:hypothetical protein LMH87_005600 [Akanthomyces muscarius]|uniref:Uncharacterized protein n=1 Tax=Akanthomyces muscarius TaxID=2231603 RepID=A0A9W8US61_AKAMU|nr:hypothetical protein LMH87_005600 [Akanthomyces muscarius]KAJ4163898.1 hypothetical protein LMH87_005600 [Akanthomyces muscarius]
MGLRSIQGKNAGTKVFVTATVDHNDRGALISNYARPSSTNEPYTFGYKSDENNILPMTLRAAARITSIMPQYFSAVTRNGIDRYTDGSLSDLSNHFLAALCEAHAIWPMIIDRGPDILVSVRGGLQDRNTWHQKLTHWGPTSNKLLKEMNTDQKWQETINTLQMSDVVASVRLNPKEESNVPNPYDHKQLGAGELQVIVEKYFAEHSTTIDGVARKLFATTFYFHAGKLPKVNEELVQGFIMCRFIHGSEEMRGLVETLQEMRNPRIEYDGENGENRVLMGKYLSADTASGRLRILVKLRLSKD